ncbi:hypothetical protein Tco_0702144 [Tanacetum coccineum]|uniref:Uncharacterized protein n=1 Tax=Tanacetum coccineum TaxID=301880 RepID=A0ABQ4XX38_9ASTR
MRSLDKVKERQARTRGNLTTTTNTTDNFQEANGGPSLRLNNNFPRGRMWPELTPLGLVKEKRHYRSDCPELKNQNHGNQAEGIRAHGVVHALRGGETNQDPNNIKDEIEA